MLFVENAAEMDYSQEICLLEPQAPKIYINQEVRVIYSDNFWFLDVIECLDLSGDGLSVQYLYLTVFRMSMWQVNPTLNSSNESLL